MTDAPPEQAWFAKADEDLNQDYCPALTGDTKDEVKESSPDAKP